MNHEAISMQYIKSARVVSLVCNVILRQPKGTKIKIKGQLMSRSIALWLLVSSRMVAFAYHPKPIEQLTRVKNTSKKVDHLDAAKWCKYGIRWKGGWFISHLRLQIFWACSCCLMRRPVFHCNIIGKFLDDFPILLFTLILLMRM